MKLIAGFSGMGKTWVLADEVVEALMEGKRALVLSDGDADFMRKFMYTMDKSIPYHLTYCRFNHDEDVLEKIRNTNPETFDIAFIDGAVIREDNLHGAININDIVKLEAEIGKPIVATRQLARNRKLEQGDQVIRVSNYDGEKYDVLKNYTYSEMRERFDKIGGSY